MDRDLLGMQPGVQLETAGNVDNRHAAAGLVRVGNDNWEIEWNLLEQSTGRRDVAERQRRLQCEVQGLVDGDKSGVVQNLAFSGRYVSPMASVG